MTSPAAGRADLLASQIDTYHAVARENIVREYPVFPWIIADSPADYRLHREAHPAFYGSFDWHSCVEMFWVAVRLMRLYPDHPANDATIALLDAHLTDEHLAVETAFFADDRHKGFERPYGWGWLLALWHECARWDHPHARRWHLAISPLANVIMDRFAAWLPNMRYPQRIGMHSNTAFGLTLAWDAVGANRPGLLSQFQEKAGEWFGDDTNYPFAYEPSGADFLSAGLCEAVLMQRVLEPAAFVSWLDGFFPEAAASQPVSIFTPAVVTDPSDGQIAHLQGLNLSRAWAFATLADILGEDDPRHAPFTIAARRHADASIDDVAGSHYMVEHWLAVYAVLYLTVGRDEKPPGKYRAISSTLATDDAC